MSSSNSGKTVRFNVGGTMYEVSRSLLEQHGDNMLARMASERWQREGHNSSSSTDEPLFIERNGERFQYVLDYMRDGGSVYLPFLAVSKDALLKELEYYGIDRVCGENIAFTGAATAFKASHACMLSLETKHKRLMDTSLKQGDFRMLAQYCAMEFRKTGMLTIVLRSKNDDCVKKPDLNFKFEDAQLLQIHSAGMRTMWHYDVVHADEGMVCFQSFLSFFGLTFRRRTTSYYCDELYLELI
jgi:hypothetical protein